nr:hypothetical protein [Natronorubrum halalkaliphilum]
MMSTRPGRKELMEASMRCCATVIETEYCMLLEHAVTESEGKSLMTL